MRQVETAISSLTTPQMTGPEANPGPPAHWLEGCQMAAAVMENYPDLNVCIILESFCLRNSPLYREHFLEKSETEPRLN